MAKKGGNPQNFNNPEKKSLEPLTFRLTDKQMDDFVRSLPNRNEWLRKVVSEAVRRELGGTV
jgi:hypothetical protein